MLRPSCLEDQDTAESSNAGAFRRLDWQWTPWEVAQRLESLGQMIWLDSAQSEEGSLSILAAKPGELLQGSLDQDWHHIDRWLRTHSRKLPGDAGVGPGLPAGGLFGWVGFDGAFTLGHYPEVLVYLHEEHAWWEWGEDLAKAVESAAVPVTRPPARVRPFEPAVTREAFLAQVERAKEYIAAGDIYQVNLAYPWTTECPQEIRSLDLYTHLRQVSPAPHAAYMDLNGSQVLSASPELFLRLSGNRITTRPIKGTRPRFPIHAEQDEASREELLHSAKERAELLMITDLERNDLGQVCDFGSVQVSELWEVEAFPQVFHLVSTVQGRLTRSTSHADAFRACFPGGSITGAPKKRAREIIAELEPHERGIYTGSIGGFGYNGESFWNVAIRTAIRRGEQLHFHTGAGIVADSDPEAEHQETVHKAAGLRLLTTRK